MTSQRVAGMTNLITSAPHQTRKEVKFWHISLLLVARTDRHLSIRLWHPLQCEFEKQIHRHHYSFPVREEPRCYWLYSQWDRRDSPEDWFHIEVCSHLWLAFPFCVASNSQALPSQLSLPIYRWKGTPTHCLRLENIWVSCHLEAHLHQPSKLVSLFECLRRNELHQLLLKWCHLVLKQRQQFQCWGKHQVRITLWPIDLL